MAFDIVPLMVGSSRRKRSVKNSNGYINYDSDRNQHGIIKRSVKESLTGGVFNIEDDIMDYMIVKGFIFTLLPFFYFRNEKS